MHRASEIPARAYTLDERHAAREIAHRLVREALRLPTPDARLDALIEATQHRSPLVGYCVTACLIDAVARHGRLEWFE